MCTLTAGWPVNHAENRVRQPTPAPSRFVGRLSLGLTVRPNVHVTGVPKRAKPPTLIGILLGEAASAAGDRDTPETPARKFTSFGALIEAILFPAGHSASSTNRGEWAARGRRGTRGRFHAF